MAFKNSTTYDAPIAAKVKAGMTGEDLFFDLALEDLNRAADMFKPLFDRTNGVDGWVSLEVSPLLAHDTAGTVAAAKTLHEQSHHSNLFIKIPGTTEGLPAIEEAIFAGVPCQRHAALLRRPLCRRGGGLYARHRAPDRSRAQSRGRVRGLCLRQPVGRRGRENGAGRVGQHAGHRHGPADLQSLSRSDGVQALAAHQ